MLRKRILKCWFGLPTSSFGEHKVLKYAHSWSSGCEIFDRFWYTIVCSNLLASLQDDHKTIACYYAMRWFSVDAMILCNKFARWSQTMIACHAICIVWWCVGPIDAIIFCNNSWTVEQAVWRVFSNHFSTSSSPNPVLTPLKSASKRHDRSFVLSSKIFVWGA